ncbi:MAG: C39 family peptidase [Patescibacteria group bacterium]
MRKRPGFSVRQAVIILGIVALVGVAGWMFRGVIRDWKDLLVKPVVPTPMVFVPRATSSLPTLSAPTSSEEKPPTPTPVVAPSTQEKPIIQPGEKPPIVEAPLSQEVNLAVPFLSQAPTGDWSDPYQEACEEASMIMVDAFYRGQTRISSEEGDAAILNVVAFEETFVDGRQDITAEETAAILRLQYGYKNVQVLPIAEASDIKKILARGYPVIVPAYGKALGNPNFRNGGPKYHMLVIKGYLKDGRFITNDPGTRKGADYVYTERVLMNAIHDLNGGDVQNGKKLMIVVMPS